MSITALSTTTRAFSVHARNVFQQVYFGIKFISCRINADSQKLLFDVISLFPSYLNMSCKNMLIQANQIKSNYQTTKRKRVCSVVPNLFQILLLLHLFCVILKIIFKKL